MGKHKNKQKQTQERSAPKRTRVELTESDSSTDTDIDLEVSVGLQSWPRFIVLGSLDEHPKLSKLSPFAIQKAVNGIAGETGAVRKLGSGDLLIECVRKQQADNLLHCKKFVGIPVRASPHKTMNSSKGVVRSRDLDGTNEEEMVQNLGPQGVTAVKRVSVRRDGVQVQTNTYILTFDTPVAPKSVKAGFVNLSVSLFIPNPLRCFNCQRFGHHRERCKRNVTCPRCGKEGHDGSDCHTEVRCINCDGSHPAYSKVCPRWVHEREIQTVRTKENITFPEAKKIVDSRVNASVANKTYAAVIKSDSRPSSRSVSVQTDLTWPEGSEFFSQLPKQSTAIGVSSLDPRSWHIYYFNWDLIQG